MGGGGDDDGIAASLNGRERRHKSMTGFARGAALIVSGTARFANVIHTRTHEWWGRPLGLELLLGGSRGREKRAQAGPSP